MSSLRVRMSRAGGGAQASSCSPSITGAEWYFRYYDSGTASYYWATDSSDRHDLFFTQIFSTYYATAPAVFGANTYKYTWALLGRLTGETCGLPVTWEVLSDPTYLDVLSNGSFIMPSPGGELNVIAPWSDTNQDADWTANNLGDSFFGSPAGEVKIRGTCAGQSADLYIDLADVSTYTP